MTLKQWRKMKGWSINKAAVEMAIPRRTLTRIERGLHGGKGPGGKTMAAIHFLTKGVVSIEDMCDKEYYDAYYERQRPILEREEERRLFFERRYRRRLYQRKKAERLAALKKENENGEVS